VYTLEELKALGRGPRSPALIIASDGHVRGDPCLTFEVREHLNACPALYDRTVVETASEAYSMTGWRIGYCGGPAAHRGRWNMQSHSPPNPTSIAQYAAGSGVNGDQSCIAPMVKAFKERRHLRRRGAHRIPA